MFLLMNADRIWVAPSPLVDTAASPLFFSDSEMNPTRLPEDISTLFYLSLIVVKYGSKVEVGDVSRSVHFFSLTPLTEYIIQLVPELDHGRVR